MTKFIIQLSPAVLGNFEELCSLKGISVIGISIIDNQVILSAICPEYMKIAFTDVQVDVDDLSIRVPTSVLKPLLSLGALAFELDTNLVISKLYNNSLVARVRIPLELDFNEEIISEVISQRVKHMYDPEIDLSSIVSLRDIVSIKEKGIQIQDGIAYVCSDGFVVYRKIDTSLKFIVSQDCLVSLINFIKTFGTVQMYDVKSYHAVYKKGMMYCWRKSREYVPNDYDMFTSLDPIYSTSANLASLAAVVRGIPSVRTKTYDAMFAFDSGYLQIQVGSMETYVLTFSQDVLKECSDNTQLRIEVPYQVLRHILGSSALTWSSVIINVYESCIEFKSGDISAIMVRQS